MKNLEDIIILFFKRVSAENILNDPDKQLFYKNIPCRSFEKLSSAYIHHYSGNERSSLYEHLKTRFEEMEKILHGWIADPKAEKSWNVFNLLFLFSRTVLLEERGEIMCYYDQLLSWRHVTRMVSEELMVSAFCAINDVSLGKCRKRFDWKLIISNNNMHLNRLLAAGLADNHFHLWASAPVFQLSWVRLMNDIESPDFSKAFQEMDDNRRKRNIRYAISYSESKMALQHLQAAAIRLFLYSWLTGVRIKLENYHISASDFRKYIDPYFQNMMEQWNVKKEDFSDIRNLVKVFISKRKNTTPHSMKKFLENFPSGQQEVLFDDYSEKKVNFWTILNKYLDKEGVISLEWAEPVIRKESQELLWMNCTRHTMERFLQNPELLYLHTRNIQNIIEGLRPTNISTENVWDYILVQLSDRSGMEEAVWYLSGERWFLYQMFRQMRIYENYEKYYQWFYAYLVIQANIRSEMIQMNAEAGLQNFILHEKRKGQFLNKDDWKHFSVRMAVQNTLQNPAVKILEARISPCDTAREDAEYIRGLDSMIDPENTLRHKYYYVMHFIKEEETIEDSHFKNCRSWKLRRKVQKQAESLALFRERYMDIASRVKGIDAASSEIGCRPEVFAQAFRFLRAHSVELPYKEEKKLQLRMLGATYHVGEDFVDLADGLRAIHEAVRFLNLNCGDRLGHALALGVDARQWYEQKNHLIVISQQDYLDNLAWLHGRITRSPMLEMETLVHFLEWEFDRYFKNVYTKNMDVVHSSWNFTIEAYYSAWKLRSDNPSYYDNQEGRFQVFHRPLPGYESYGINDKCPRARRLREIAEVAFLYHTYHFNEAVKRDGAKKVEVKIPDVWVDGVICIQKKMQQLVAQYGISIESNPTSNFNIGTFKDYARHPIVQLYNARLTADEKKIRECPQISVSINTDDQGIFSTSLENEYALMACALEQERDDQGNRIYSRNMIYDWLEEIRKMGLRQSFAEGRD